MSTARELLPTVPNRVFGAEVIATSPLSPGLVRVAFGGPDLKEFLSTGVGDEYLRIFFPHTADRGWVSLPEPSEDRGWDFPEGAPEAPMRTYTVRSHRPDAGEVDIDFVVHEGGIAAAWALAAQPGDVVGINSPTALYAPPADVTWQLLVADQTGLPGALRILEQTQPGVRTRLVLEIPDDEHRVTLPAIARADEVEVRWVHGGNGHDHSRVAEVVRQSLTDEQLAGGLDEGYVWVAGETKVLREVRRFLRREHGIPGDRYKVVGYWTEHAEAYRQTYEALDEEIKAELIDLWDSDRDPEVIEDEYVDRLESLGL